MPTATRTYSVPDVSCDHCKNAIEGEVGKLADVSTVTVDVASRTVAVDGDASDAAITAAINEAGYDVAEA